MLNGLVFSLILFMFWGVFSPVQAAISKPAFSVCSNPNGSVIAQYSSGTHGIAGNTNEFIGSDTVYSLSDGNALQCFCGSNGEGIQTMWWKIGELNKTDLNNLEAEGWIFIPTGAPWGLDPMSYLAKNINYACLGSHNNNDSSGVNGAAFTASDRAGDVLGLATTGSLQQIVGLFLSGSGLILLSICSRRKYS